MEKSYSSRWKLCVCMYDTVFFLIHNVKARNVIEIHIDKQLASNPVKTIRITLCKICFLCQRVSINFSTYRTTEKKKRKLSDPGEDDS